MARKRRLSDCSEGLFFSALCGTKAAILKDCRANCIQSAALPYAVGYSQSLLNGGEENITLIAPQFINVGEGDEINLQDITCGEDEEDMVMINTLLPDGQLDQTFTWASAKGKLCWVDDSYREAQGVTFKAGTALWIQCDMDGNETPINSAGQVNTADSTIELNGGDENITLTGNAYPVELDLQDILAPDDGEDLIMINTLLPDGQLDQTFTWASAKGKLCWVDDSYREAQGVTFQAGQGFWIQCDMEEGGYLTFPGVELK